MPLPRILRRPSRLAVALLATLLAACGGDGPSRPDTEAPRLAAVRITPATVTLAEGDSTTVTAAGVDQTGAPFPLPSGVFVVWTSSDPSVVVSGTVVTATVKAVAPGSARITARVQGVDGGADVTVPRVVVAFTKVDGDGQGGAPGAPLPRALAVRVRDSRGAGIPGVTVRFAVTSGGGRMEAAEALSDTGGVARVVWVPGHAPGEQTAEAQVEGVAAPLVFRARTDGQPVLQVDELAADTLRPGGSFVLRGRGFDTSPAGMRVTVAGAEATVTAAARGQLTVSLPSRTLLPCRAGAPVEVAVMLAGAPTQTGVVVQRPLVTATGGALAPGQRVTYDVVDALCMRLPAGGTYVLSVHNLARAGAEVAPPYQLRGAAEGAPAAPVRRTTVTPPRLTERQRREADHLRHLEETRRLVSRLGPVRRNAADGPRRAMTTRRRYGVGDTVEIRVRNTSVQQCGSFATVPARVVYAGPRVLVAEDPGNARRDLDAQYRALGAEMDGPMWEVLSENFGDPLAMDDQLDADGRIILFVSRVVNTYHGISLGFVNGLDYYPRSECSMSNTGEIAYLRAPEATTDPDAWLRDFRATAIHEVKHIVSISERRARGLPGEDGWLEEATARAAEEIWARPIYGFRRGGNTGFDVGVRCNVSPDAPGCRGEPNAMLKHFGQLYDDMRLSSTRSPMAGGNSIYGAGWSFVRWAADHAPMDEAAFFQALINASDRGAYNLEGRTGRPWAELLGDWGLAMAADDRPGFVPADPRLRFPSWNLPDVFAGMHDARPSQFPLASPWEALAVGGAFEVTVPAPPGGSAGLFELTAPAGGPQRVELRNPTVAPGVYAAVDGTYRLAVVRLR